jgi:glycosyltransferase involved in cell wall biosynthesis
MGADWAAPIVDAATSFASGNPGRIVENPYILCVSTLEYRKNHKRLLEAFAEVRRHVKNVDLVVVGEIDSSISEGTLEFCRRNPWVQHFERVDDTTLRRLYQDCLFSVYPSLDEGYGLPVIESFRYRKFCLASHAGAIPEAGGKFADYFDPYNVQMLIRKILMYVGNPEELQRRQELLELYKPTLWRETAWQVAQIFYGDTASQAFVRDAEQG